MTKKLILFFYALVIFYITSESKNNIQYFSLITMPKSGTHIPIKLFKLFRLFTQDKSKIVTTAPKDFFLLTETFMKQFFKIRRILVSHVIFNESNVHYLGNPSFQNIFIYRQDPRDQVVSAAFFIRDKLNVLPYKQFDLNTIIDNLINDTGTVWGTLFNDKQAWSHIKNITDFYHAYLPWQKLPNVYTTTFEKLVGPRGGGSEQEQLNEIISIARLFKVDIDHIKAKQIARKLFGQTPTFREGQIGSWKKYLLPRHIEAFKYHADLLDALGCTWD